MWGTGGAAGEAKVAGGSGVDPPPPPPRGGWVGGRVVATSVCACRVRVQHVLRDVMSWVLVLGPLGAEKCTLHLLKLLGQLLNLTCPVRQL